MQDRSDFHALTARIDYPMFVATTAAGDERAGCLVGFTTQCSIDPPRYLVCISQANHTHRVAARAAVLALHVLRHDQRHLAELFGAETGDETDKFERCRWRPGPDGVPVLEEAPAGFVGRVIDRLDTGDHTAYVLELLDAWAPDGTSGLLTFHDVRDLHPGHPA
jgi:flavin reductase (DIM6/NTAB) family NADH-FMN oxidoreductase RutF